jgi:hypothetical protein
MKKILRSIIGLMTTALSASAMGIGLYSPEVMSTPNSAQGAQNTAVS